MANEANDLERYRQDQMTLAERRAFEMRAVEDPFLRDAVSGSESLTPDAFTTDVGDLNRRLDRQRTPWFTPIRIAAGIVIVSTVGWLVYRTTSVEPESVAVLKKDSTAITDSTSKLLTLAAPQKDSAGEPEKKDPIKSIAKAPAVKPSEVQTTSTQPAPSSTANPSASGVVAKTEPAKTEPAQAEAVKTEIAKTEIAEDAQRDKASRVEEPAPSALQKRAIVAQPQTVTGTVREAERGLPLAGVSVTEKESKQKAETGPDGRYTIPVTRERATLQYSYEGLKTVERKADASRAQDVTLADDVLQKSEVLVFPSDSSASSAPIVLASPNGGLDAYGRYLEENQRVPDAARTARISGKVTVGFEVTANGTLSGFRVLKSLGYGCDEEVLRLVRSGPSWSPTVRGSTPQSSTVWVKLEFVADR